MKSNIPKNYKLENIYETKCVISKTPTAQILEDQEGNVEIIFPFAPYNPLKITNIL